MSDTILIGPSGHTGRPALDTMTDYETMLRTLDMSEDDVTVCHDLLKDTVLGETRFEYGPPRHARITLQPRLGDYPAMEDAVLWHELCHAEPWVHEGKTQGHSWPWLVRLFKIPELALMDMIVGLLWLFVK